MTASTAPSELVNVSQRLGSKPAFVQGGGGNISLKTSDGMWIKASGTALRDATADKGFVTVDDARIRDGLNACQAEADYGNLLNACKIAGAGRPSMEAGFHVLLSRAVLHSHAVLANLLACAAEGESLLDILLPEALWVPYVAPGLPLTRSISDFLKNGKEISIILLQNHGLIVSDATPEAAWKLHEHCCQIIADHFKIKVDDLTLRKNMAADAAHTLFPDQVVYLENALLRETRAGQETLWAYGVLHTLMSKRGLTPCYLPQQEVDLIKNMESEKYRQRLVNS